MMSISRGARACAAALALSVAAPAGAQTVENKAALSNQNTSTIANCAAGVTKCLHPATFSALFANIIASMATLVETNVFHAPQVVALDGSGYPAPQGGTIIQEAQADGVVARHEIDAFGAATHFTGVRWDGTFTSPVGVASGAEVVAYNGWAYNGVAVIGPIAGLRLYAAEALSSGHQGSSACLATTPIGATAQVNSGCQGPDGGWTIGAPTGGDLGTGSLNAPAVYQNGVKAAASGANTDITSLGDLTTPLPVAEGGTGAAVAGAAAAHNIGAAASGANTDITSLGGLTTPLSVGQGGTGSTTASGALANLGGAPLASPNLTGAPTAPTQTTGDASTKLATDAFVQNTIGALQIGVGFRNRLINGDFRISLYNGASSFSTGVTAGTYGAPDRWYVSATGAALTAQQVAGDAPNLYALHIAGAASNTGFAFGQRIQAADIYDQEGLTDTLQIRARCSIITTLNWAAYYPGSTDTWSSRTSVASGSWTITASYANYNTNIALTSAIEAGLEIEFSVGATPSGTCDFENAQLEPGSTATTFERRPLAVEAGLVSWFHQRNVATAAYSSFGLGVAATTSTANINLNYSRMRIPPTITQSNAYVNQAGASMAAVTSIPTVYAGPVSATLNVSVSGTPLTAGTPLFLQANNNGAAYIDYNSEL